jgi:hypothetical protein
MKKLFYVFIVALIFAACTGKKDKAAGEVDQQQQAAQLVTYQYKIDGLQDSIISDSIWRIIFQVEGIDKMVLSRDDSTAVFTVNPELVTSEQLKKEIASRGGVVLD